MAIEVNLRLDLKVGFKVGFKVVSLFFWAHGFLYFLMDGHPQDMAVLFPCSLSPGFKEAVMRITLFHSFHVILFLALRCITRGGSIAYLGLSRRWRCLVQPEAEMPCTVEGEVVLYSRRRRFLKWPETEMFRMAGDSDISYGPKR
jgi:hypothetical protein